MAKNGTNKKPNNKKPEGKTEAQQAQERMSNPPALQIVKDTDVAKLPATPAPEGEKPAKKAKKISEQVKNWKAQKAFPMDFVITEVRKDNPKRKDAARRFALYEEGMTVQQYTDKAVKDGITKALAMADMRWDHCAGFVTIVEPKAKK